MTERQGAPGVACVPGTSEMAWLHALIAETEAGRPVVLVTALQGPRPGTRLLVGPEGRLAGDLDLPGVTEAAQDVLRLGKPATIDVAGGGLLYLEPFLPSPALVVVGAGHVAQPLVTAGKLAGFAVTVLDDRPSLVTTERFPDADRRICDDFLKGLEGLSIGPRHHVVLVTRGHQHDLACLRQVLRRSPSYIGMIGSRRRVLGIFQRLLDEGFPPESLERVHAPIGLDLGAETPGEIAISIAAELVRLRRGGTGEHLSRATRGNIHRFRRTQP